MTKQATKTANTGAPTTREKAAKKAASKPEIRPEIQACVTAIRRGATSLNNAVYKAAITSRELDATPEEIKAQLAEMPKQRKADFKRIVEAPAEHVDERMPSNLIKAARYLAYRAKDYSPSLARDIVDGKQSDPAKKKGPDGQTSGQRGAVDTADTGGAPGDTAAPAPVNDTAPGPDTGAVALIQKGIEQLMEQYGDSKAMQAAIRAMSKGLENAVDHINKIEANEKAKQGKKSA